jgi:hypothetical protein
LIVDPALAVTSVFGGSGSDVPRDIGVDATGNIYLLGDTSSIDFPLQQPYQLAPSSGQSSSRHLFVTKLDPTASHILFSTYLGGSLGESARRIAVNSAGEVFVTGSTRSPDYPVTAGALNYSNPSSLDNVVISKLSSSGALLTSAVLGGTNDDEVAGLALDAAGAIYLSGTTNSPNFPVTAGARNDLSKLDSLSSGAKVFVIKLNSSMNSLLYSSVIGGTGVGSGFRYGYRYLRFRIRCRHNNLARFSRHGLCLPNVECRHNGQEELYYQTLPERRNLAVFHISWRFRR